MAGEKSVHDVERDRIANDWCDIAPFTCTACRSEGSFPKAKDIRIEAVYRGRLRADVAVVDASGSVSGVMEVILFPSAHAAGLGSPRVLGVRLLPATQSPLAKGA